MTKKIISIALFVVLVSGVFVLTGCCDKLKENKTDYLVLVNKQHKLPDSWEKEVQLEEAKNAWNETIKVEKKALKNYWKLRDELAKENVIIVLDSAYRSVKEQKELWADFEKKYGIDYVKKTVAVPGYSEHHTGLAIDIVIKKDGKLIEENGDMIKERAIFAKVHKKLAKHGFILRYLEGKDDITGYSYEPWHLRYVGKKDAKKIMDKKITLEEYLNKVDK